MPLPVSPRVVFNKNPLYSVMAEVRFPTILLIQANAPVEFQESVRAEFPGYSVVGPAVGSLPPDIPEQVQAIIRSSLPGILGGVEKAHQFTTADGNWTVHLTSGSLSLTCKKYPRWEEFRRRLHSVFDPFMRIYRPPFASLIGLRYQNAIRRNALGLASVPWAKLLKPFIADELAADGIDETEIINNVHRFELNLGSVGRVQVQHGVAMYKPTSERVYSIDNNFTSNQRVELNDVYTRLDAFNGYSGSLFRYCITDQLFDALEPHDA